MVFIRRFLTCLNPHTNCSNLIIAVIGLSQLDQLGHLGKHGFDLIGFRASDWNHPTVLLTVLHFLCMLFQTSCVHSCFINVPNLINHWQLIRITVQPTSRQLPNLNEVQTVQLRNVSFKSHYRIELKPTHTCSVVEWTKYYQTLAFAYWINEVHKPLRMYVRARLIINF